VIRRRDDGAAGEPGTGLPRGLALLVAGAFFMEILDGTVIAPAAPLIAADLGIRAVDVNVAISGYLVTVAVLIPISGWAADRFGTRRVFATAIVLFTLASAGCALAPDLATLTVTRVLQGVGGALMVPVGRLAVLRATAKADLIKAIAYLTWPALLAPVLAPAIGGVLSDGIVSRYGLRTGRVVPSFVGLIVCGGLLIAGSHAANATLAALTLAAGVGALYISQSSYWSVTADIGGRNAGVVSSIMNTGAQVGGAVTTTLTPWLADRFGWWAGFLAAALLAFAGAFAWLGVDPETQLSASDQVPASAIDNAPRAG